MKKRNLKSLRLQKELISNFQYKIMGGQQKKTKKAKNCPCPPPPPDPCKNTDCGESVCHI